MTSPQGKKHDNENPSCPINQVTAADIHVPCKCEAPQGYEGKAEAIVEGLFDHKCSCWLTDSPCDHCDKLVSCIANALRSEAESVREECARIAEGFCNDSFKVVSSEYEVFHNKKIAKKIRESK